MDFLVAHFAEIMFYLLAALTVAGAVGVVALRNPVHCAISLLWTFLMVAALFVLRHAEFLAAVQVLVYAGGILVLFLFVIMLVQAKHLRADSAFLARQAPLAVMLGVVLGALVAIGVLLGAASGGSGDPATLQMVDGQVIGNTQAVGWELYRTYLVPFEIVSVVLLVAMVAAIVYGRKEPGLEARGEGSDQ